MRAELVDAADLEAVRDEWNALYAADPLATPFMSPGWARAWLKHWAPDARPWMVLVRDGDRAAGLMPLAIRRRGLLRMLSMIGKEPGDYWDILAAPPDRAAVTAAAATELARRRTDWDVGLLSCIVPESTTGDALAVAGLRVIRRADVRCPAITLPATFDEYLAPLPNTRRKAIRRALRRVDEGEVELHAITDPDTLPSAVARLQEIHVRQWEDRGRSIEPSHRTERFRAFLLSAVQELAPAGEALVWEFRVNGATAGMYVNFVDARSFYGYIGGFDLTYSQLGIGRIEIASSIRNSVEHGRERYDFTRGSEPYKYWYGAHDRLAPSIVIGNSRPRSRAVLAAASIVTTRTNVCAPGVSARGARFGEIGYVGHAVAGLFWPADSPAGAERPRPAGCSDCSFPQLALPDLRSGGRREPHVDDGIRQQISWLAPMHLTGRSGTVTSTSAMAKQA